MNIFLEEESHYIETFFETLNGDVATDEDLPPEFYDILGQK